jgi:hypothetical protein
MSVTWTLACLDCKASIWVGQGTREPYLYGHPKALAALMAFLRQHGYRGPNSEPHRLCFYMDGCEPPEMEPVFDENELLARRGLA